MTTQEFNIEVKNTKEVMASLLECVKDKSITSKERKQYRKDYMQTAQYYLTLQKNRPTLTIA